jgi:hypothetical protein
MRRCRYGFLGLLLVAATACGGSTTTGPSGQVTPPTVDVFTGTLAPGGLNVHPFTVARNNGTLEVTLTRVSTANLQIGLGVGTPSGTACTFLTGASLRTGASTTPQLSGTSDAGSFCIGVFDVGTLTEAVTYSVTISHY